MPTPMHPLADYPHRPTPDTDNNRLDLPAMLLAALILIIWLLV